MSRIDCQRQYDVWPVANVWSFNGSSPDEMTSHTSARQEGRYFPTVVLCLGSWEAERLLWGARIEPYILQPANGNLMKAQLMCKARSNVT